MDYRNKLGTFTFDDNVQESHMKLIVQNVTGQYLSPKKGEPELTDEESCYEFIRERCGNVLGGIGFDLEINHDVRIYTKEQLVAKKIKDFDNKIKQVGKAFKNVGETIAETAKKLHIPESTVRPVTDAGWLVGPAAVKH